MDANDFLDKYDEYDAELRDWARNNPSATLAQWSEKAYDLFIYKLWQRRLDVPEGDPPGNPPPPPPQ